MKTLVDKRVQINLYPFKDFPNLLEVFGLAAAEQGWSDSEITLVLSQTKGLTLDEKYSMLKQYCTTYGEDAVCIQEDVRFLLHFLGCRTHYLNDKPLHQWDEYDQSNFNSLKRKATRSIKAVFAHFDETVEEKDKYEAGHSPDEYYDTHEEALEAVPVGRESTINIYALWITS